MLYYIILYFVISWPIILYYIIFCHVMSYYIVLYYIIQNMLPGAVLISQMFSFVCHVLLMI
jgi:hypothetical protein